MPVSPLDVIVVGDAVPVNATTLVLGLEPRQPIHLRTECYVYGDGFVGSDTHRQRGLHH